ncbi:LptF/LptG family permease [Oceanithermus sp.]
MGSILDRYLLREVVPVLLVSALLYVAVFLFGFFYVGSRWLDGAPVLKVFTWLGYHVPGVLVQVLPMAVVSAIVIPFGRLATEGAIIATQAGGISLVRLLKPVLLLGILLAGFSLYLSEKVVPWSNARVRGYWYDELTTPGRGLARLRGKTVPLGEGLELYFPAFDYKTGEMLNVRLQLWKGRQATVIFADRGSYDGRDIKLTNYRIYTVDYAAIDQILTASEDELAAKLKNVFKNVVVPRKEGATTTIKTGLSRDEALANFADPLAADTLSLSEAWRRYRDPNLPPADRQDAALAFHSKLALPLANVVLILLSLPFAVRYGRSPGLSMGMSVMIAVGYYLVFMLSRSMGGLGLLPPWLAAWFADVAFALVGWRMIRS